MMDEIEVKPLNRTALARLRHVEFKAACITYWTYMNPDTPLVWERQEGMNLEIWLRNHPGISLDQFKACLRNRVRSEGVDHSQPPSKWIHDILRYAAGPLNRDYGPLGGVSAAEVRERVVRESAERSSTAQTEKK